MGIDPALVPNPFGLFLNSSLGLGVDVGLDGDNLSWAKKRCHEQKKQETDGGLPWTTA